MRHLSPLPRRPGCGMWATRPSVAVTPYDIADFGAAFYLEAPLLADPTVSNVRGTLTLAAGTPDIISAVDAAGGALVLSRVAAGRECAVDETVPFNGRAAIRTQRTGASLRTLTGGVSAANAPHYMCALARPVAVAANASNLATFILYGMPQATNNGIGSGTPPDKVAFGGNVISFTQPTAFDTTGVHTFESTYTGTEGRYYIDGVLVATRTVALTLNGANATSFGLASWFEAARAIQDTRVFKAVFKNAVPAFADRMLLLAALGEGAHTIPLNIHGKGDSRTLGTGSTAGNDFLTQLVAQYALNGRTVTQKNDGLSGKRSDEIIATLNTVNGGELHSPFRVNVDQWFMGYNDINQLGSTPTSAAAIYANTVTGIDFSHAYGNKAVVLTVPTSGPFESNPTARAMLLAYNALVLANAGGADLVIDVAPYFEPYDAAKYSDTLHFTNASQLVLAQMVYAALAATGW